MNDVVLASSPLQALGFRPFTPETLRGRPILKRLQDRIGTDRRVYIRTHAYGCGYTLARDQAGNLKWTEGQFDLTYHCSFRELPRLMLRPA